MSIRFHSEHPTYRLKEILKHRRWINRVINLYGKTPGEIDIIFTTNEFLLNINKEYLNHPYFTDVITFDYTMNDIISGEIYISRDQVKRNAKEYNSGIQEETRRVMIHGILHLSGFADGTQTEKKEMRKQEDEALALWNKFEDNR